MKRWEYARPWKLAALLVNQICAVVLVLSVVFSPLLWLLLFALFA